MKYKKKAMNHTSTLQNSMHYSLKRSAPFACYRCIYLQKFIYGIYQYNLEIVQLSHMWNIFQIIHCMIFFFFFLGGLNMRTQFKLLFSILFHLIIKIASYLYVEELPSGYEFKPHFHVLHPTEGVLINQTFLLVYAFRISVSLSNLYHQ